MNPAAAYPKRFVPNVTIVLGLNLPRDLNKKIIIILYWELGLKNAQCCETFGILKWINFHPLSDDDNPYNTFIF